MSDKVKIEYKGKIYYRLADLAHDYGISAKLVSDRWHKGHRNPKDLLEKGKLFTISPYAHQITYQGTTYNSARDFARKHDLIYGKVLSLIKKDITDPQKLIDKGKRSEYTQVEMLTKARKLDEEQRDKFLSARNLLSVQQVSKMTKVPTHPINVLANSLIKGTKKKGYLGLKKSDLVKLDFEDDEDKKKIKDGAFIGEYGFKKSAVDHILKRINIIKDREMKQLPEPFSNYYYDIEHKEVWKYYPLGYGTIRLNIFGGGKYFKFAIGKKQFQFTPDALDDIVKNPEITYQDLLTKQDIIKNSDLTASRWHNRKISKYLPPLHVRYDKTGNRVSGWTKEEILYPEKLRLLNMNKV
ncbi:hypothetical protein [Lactobacillus sp.]|uniref:hypothetical protein n=1 Tax=Lactobacillus sp. TaxID=1591 RepID=UPI00198C0B11|nr:hypothetical protein [Lactobacillus sp.]MBD5430530.1 hypothetical protein [Lactobacillus sp.]MBD5430822.1 hypothetical protein [Lactobacillus sp.]